MVNDKDEKRIEQQGRSRLRRGALATAVVGIAVVMVLSAYLGAASVPSGAATRTNTAGTPTSGPHVQLSSIGPVASNAFAHVNSTNWAGYAVVPAAGAGSIQEVTAEWYIPTANCSQPKADGAALSSQWVGIDGFNTGTVEQTGTAAYCSANGATPVYYLWWEFDPYNAAQYVYTANAGDLVQAYVLYNPTICVSGSCGVYTLDLSDISSGNTISVVGGGWICNAAAVCEGGSDASAECISEVSAGGYVLTKTTPLTFYACAVEISGTFKGIGSFSSAVASTNVLTQIGPVSGLKAQTVSGCVAFAYGKSEFTVTWHHYN
ncbi:MAG: G1 family endopeptidase [Thermoplasmata archaeon]|nr:G1 family endopeptidase [Thermoplasmata archaeon]